MAFGVAAIEVFRRSISETLTFFGLLTPSMPVRNALTRSVRGKLVGAGALGNSVESTSPRSPASLSIAAIRSASSPVPRCSASTVTPATPHVGTARPWNHAWYSRPMTRATSRSPSNVPQLCRPG